MAAPDSILEGGEGAFLREGDLVAQPLMVSLPVEMCEVLVQGMPERSFAEEDELREALLFYGAHPALREGVTALMGQFSPRRRSISPTASSGVTWKSLYRTMPFRSMMTVQGVPIVLYLCITVERSSEDPLCPTGMLRL